MFEAAADLLAVENGTSRTAAMERSFGLPSASGAGHQKTTRRPESAGPRRTPRRSVIVVLTENDTVAADLIDDRLQSESDADHVDVIVACAGQPSGVGLLAARLRDVQVVLAPAGTSGEDLRQLAIQHAAGDIITLVSGVPV